MQPVLVPGSTPQQQPVGQMVMPVSTQSPQKQMHTLQQSQMVFQPAEQVGEFSVRPNLGLDVSAIAPNESV